MKISEISIKRPVLASMMSLGLVLFGLIGLMRLPVREIPDIDPPIVNVSTTYLGANASIIESQVTERLEEVLAGIEGIRTMTSTSREQQSAITIEFDLTRDIDLAAQDVRDRVSRVRGRLPDDIEEPVIAKQDADARPSMWVALFSDEHTTLELTMIAENILKDRLQTVPGVSSIFIGGSKRYAIRIWLDSNKMAARGITVIDVEEALRKQSVELPSGRIENRERELFIETKGKLITPDEYNQLVIKQDNEKLVRLHDIGYAASGVEDEHSIARYNSRPSVGLGIVRQSKANIISVAKGVKEALRDALPILPEGIQTAVAYDESIFIEKSIKEVWITLFIAFLFVVAAIYLFLHNVRATIVPTVTIPISIIATFGVLYLFGYSINIVTMLALVLAIGLVVDDAIVVLENIYRHIESGISPYQAALKGMREIAFAVIATTVALVAVFLPMAFQTSITGRIFIEFAVAIAFAVMISSFVALTLSPMIASRVLKNKSGYANPLVKTFAQYLDFVSTKYKHSLSKILNHRIKMLLVIVGTIILSVFFYSRLEKEFIPDEDKGRLFCIAISPEGSTSEYTNRMVLKMEDEIKATPEVLGYFTAVALSRGGPGQSTEGLSFIRLKQDKRKHIKDIIGGPKGMGSRFFMNIQGAIAFPTIPKSIGRGFGQTFRLVLQNQNLDKLNEYTKKISNSLRKSGFLMNVRPTFEMNKPEINLSIDRDRAASLGVSIDNIARTLQILFGGLDINTVNMGGKEYDVIAQLERESRLTPSDLEKLYIRNNKNSLIQLSSVVTYSTSGSPSAIHHYNRYRSANIEATPINIPLGTAIEKTEKILAEELPKDFRYEWDGEAKDLKDASSDTLFVLILAIIIIYMVLAAQFESLIHPLTVMLSLPLGAVGALGLLWLLSGVDAIGNMFYGWSHYAPNAPFFAHFLDKIIPRIPSMGINLYSQIGLILLLGLVTKNAILLIEFANQQMVSGKTAEEAIKKACSIRLRPILMTAVSTIAGILPIAIGFGAGGESRRPLGVAAVGGILTSTFLTLYVIPVIYIIFDKLYSRFKKNDDEKK